MVETIEREENLSVNDVNTSDDLPDVCVVTHPLSTAGENAARSLLKILSAITNVSLVTADLPPDSMIRQDHEVFEIADDGAAQSQVSVAAWRFVRNQLRMCREIARRDESIVLFFGATAYLLPILFAQLIGRTIVLQPRGDVPLTLRLYWESRFPTPVARTLAGVVRLLETLGYLTATGIITYTPSMAEELNLTQFKQKLYPNGARYVDTDLFSPKVPYHERDDIVGFLGRLDEEKGIHELTNVAKRLPDDMTFVFAGEGSLRGWLEEELASEIESGSVELTGWIKHEAVPDVLNRFKLLILPSRPTEGLPTVILEALACGTPVYAASVSGIPDVVIDGETGILMTNRDPGVITDTIEELVRNSDGVQMSSRGRQLIETEYCFEAAVGRYRSILLRLAS